MSAFKTEEEARTYRRNHVSVGASDILQIENPPDVPLKQSREWGMLAMKRALRLAAEEGKESLIWTTGETQAERYDYLQRITSVTFDTETSADSQVPDVVKYGTLKIYGGDNGKLLKEAYV